jgi:CRP/FNR family transcriptional regulator
MGNNASKINIFNVYSPIFSKLKEDELALIEKQKTKIHYKKDDNIIKQGEIISHGIYLYTGYLKVQMDYLGKNIIVGIIPHGTFAVLPLMLVNKNHVFSLTALDECTIYYIDIEILKSAVDKNPEFTKYLFYESFQNFIQTQYRAISYVQNNIHGKVAHTILFLSEKVFRNNKFNVLLSRKELAEFSGISRENFIKVLTEMNNEGIISVKNKYFEIIDMKGLKNIASKG